MLSDEEIRKATKVTVHDGILDVVFLIAYKEDDNALRHAELFRETVLSVVDSAPQKFVDAIIDFTPIDKSKIPLPIRGGGIYRQVAKYPKIRRVAIISTKSFYRILVEFVLIAAGIGGKIKLFPIRDEALAWLKKP